MYPDSIYFKEFVHTLNTSSGIKKKSEIGVPQKYLPKQSFQNTTKILVYNIYLSNSVNDFLNICFGNFVLYYRIYFQVRNVFLDSEIPSGIFDL